MEVEPWPKHINGVHKLSDAMAWMNESNAESVGDLGTSL